jgi:hypothetical protein
VSPKLTSRRIEKASHLRWVKLGKMRINPLAQRELNTARVDKLCSEFEEERLGYPVLNLRDSWYFVIDGQHRRAALIKWLAADDWQDFEIQCYVYDGENSLTAEEEAEVFLKLNDTLTVTTYDKFIKGIQAGRPEESDIDRIVRALGLRISKQKGDGTIGAVASLRKVYRHGPGTLSRSLHIIRDAYGDAGFGAPVIEGIGLLCQRYNGELDQERAVEKLSKAHGGVNGLLNEAGRLRQKTGFARAHCVAAAAVDIYNRGRDGKKLPAWWRAEGAS